MGPNLQETVVWLHLLRKSLRENFIFCDFRNFTVFLNREGKAGVSFTAKIGVKGA